MSRAQSEGTRRMVERLAALRRDAMADETLMPPVFRDPATAARLQSELDAALTAGNAARVLDLRPRLARSLLYSGKNEEALRQFRLFRESVEAATWRLDFRQTADLAIQTAVCLIRIGEQDNCVDARNAESCLFPLRGGGVHRWTRGVTGAAAVLDRFLGQYPDDPQARWLSTVAHMAAGESWDVASKPSLLPLSLFESEAPFPRWREVGERVGVGVRGLAGGAVADDFDGDGWTDVVASDSALDGQIRIFRNTGTGTFVDRTAEAGLAGLVGGLNVVHGDFDNDGHPDLFVLRGGWWGRAGRHPNSLLRNRGDGTFEDVTEAAGMLTMHPTQTAVWWDFDGDGWLDLFVGNESTPGEEHPCELFHNKGDGTFQECATAHGLAVVAFVKGVTSGDFNRDGRPDLYVSNGQGPNLLFRNDGPMAGAAGSAWRFTEVASAAGVTEPLRSFPTWFFDYDNDSWPDLFVCGYGYQNVGDMALDALGQPHQAELPRLYRNQGNGTFSNVTASVRLNRALLGMGANFADVDGDGWLDFHVGTGDPDLATLVPNRMFRNDRGLRFQDVTTAAGVGHLQKGHGVAFADFDGDGDVDLFQVLGGALPVDAYHRVLFVNPAAGHRWLALKLEGVRSNRSAIGAEVRVETEQPSGTLTLYRTIGSGGSFGGSPMQLCMGLGTARALRRVSITWPATGRTQDVQGLEMDRAYRIWEGEARATPLSSVSFAFPDATSTGR